MKHHYFDARRREFITGRGLVGTQRGNCAAMAAYFIAAVSRSTERTPQAAPGKTYRMLHGDGGVAADIHRR